LTDLDSEGEKTDKDITGTDIESQYQEAEAAADDVLPVQIERRLNKLSTLIVGVCLLFMKWVFFCTAVQFLCKKKIETDWVFFNSFI
jgi:hypothetical protein